MSLIDFFKSLGHLLGSLFGFVHSRGLDEKLVGIALDIVTQLSSNTTLTNDQKRELAVSEIMKLGVPESIARLAVELAVQAFKSKNHQS